MTKISCLIALCVFPLLPWQAQAQASIHTLHHTLKEKDSILFNAGFNNCNALIFADLLSDGFEFYHDEGGATLSKASFIAGFMQNVCGLPYATKRVVDPASVLVYPLYDKNDLYGAVQTGSHRFFKRENGQPERLTSVARFTHLWLLDNGRWKLHRAISYDHEEQTLLPDFEHAATINAWLKANKVPSVAIGIIRDSVLQEVKVFGELSEGKPAAVTSIHNVASITKLITTLTTLRLVSSGKWDLDEPLHHFWTDPYVANDPLSKTLTTRHVLNQQSGFPNWRWELESKKLAFIHPPGTQYGYSGEGFEYLRRALEKKFKTSFEALVDETLLTPLGMSDSRLTWNDDMLHRFAIPHNAEGVALAPDKNNRPNAADLFKTTVPDLAKFLISVLRQEGLTKDVAAQMVAPVTKTKAGRYVALGWFVYDLGDGEYALSHGGDDAGAHSICFLLPKTGDGLIIFTNSDNAPAKLYSDIIKVYLGAKGIAIIDIEMN